MFNAVLGLYGAIGSLILVGLVLGVICRIIPREDAFIIFCCYAVVAVIIKSVSMKDIFDFYIDRIYMAVRGNEFTALPINLQFFLIVIVKTIIIAIPSEILLNGFSGKIKNPRVWFRKKSKDSKIVNLILNIIIAIAIALHIRTLRGEKIAALFSAFCVGGIFLWISLSSKFLFFSLKNVVGVLVLFVVALFALAAIVMLVDGGFTGIFMIGLPAFLARVFA
jgi:hypothetical protein